MGRRLYKAIRRIKKTERERFDEKYIPEPNSGCWLWIGTTTSNGYGVFGKAMKDGHHKAHRYSYERFKGDIPAGLGVLHRCDNPLCVNPDHLYAGNQKDNVRDMIARGRWAPTYGEHSGNAKYTDDIVRLLRAYKGPLKALSAETGITVAVIKNIRCRLRWKHVT